MRTVLAALTVLCISATAHAVVCNVDTDCSTATCGGQVCQWGGTHTCVAAGTDAQGSDGWCDATADCKCMSTGATCNTGTHHCTFTLANLDMAVAPTVDMTVVAAGDMANVTTPTGDMKTTTTTGGDAATTTTGGDAATGVMASSDCSMGGHGVPSLFGCLALLVLLGLSRRRIHS